MSAGRGRSAETVPCLGRGADWPGPARWERFDAGRLRDSSDSIFLRMAWGAVSYAQC